MAKSNPSISSLPQYATLTVGDESVNIPFNWNRAATEKGNRPVLSTGGFSLQIGVGPNGMPMKVNVVGLVKV